MTYVYNTAIGSYGEDVRLSINLEVKGGVSTEDYQTLRESFQTIEDTIRSYEPEPPTDATGPDSEDEESAEHPSLA